MSPSQRRREQTLTQSHDTTSLRKTLTHPGLSFHHSMLRLRTRSVVRGDPLRAHKAHSNNYRDAIDKARSLLNTVCVDSSSSKAVIDYAAQRRASPSPRSSGQLNSRHQSSSRPDSRRPVLLRRLGWAHCTPQQGRPVWSSRGHIRHPIGREGMRNC